MTVPETDIRYIKGVGEKRAKLFNKLGITNLRSLLSYFPRGYEDRSKVIAIDNTIDGENACILATLATDVRLNHIRRGLDISKVRAVDESSSLELTFFNQSFIKNSLKKGESYYFYGKITRNLTSIEMQNPKFIKETDGPWGIVPVYRSTSGLTQQQIRAAMQQGLYEVGEQLIDILPPDVRARNNLCHVRYAYQNIHFPSSPEALETARKRLIFEELFVFSCALSVMRKRRIVQKCATLTANTDEFIKALPFTLTRAQQRVSEEIAFDMASGIPMNRLIQGDVGSGKTVVAAIAVFIAAKNRKQTALMAPTEILATQHYKFFSSLLSTFNIHTTLLTGGMRAAKKRAAREAISLGTTDLVIGTHALISNNVEFDDLGLVITDEQHRFGVSQRATLSKKGSAPHLLVMSATPIPRTMALIIYGDLDISVIDELPPGRQKTDTFIIGEDKRQRMYGFIRKQVNEGRQAYIVCPAVEENETTGLKAVETYAETLRDKIFPDLKVALLHGRMKTADKERIMSSFSTGVYDILVATTVIEVGVDVPNATIMVIENAERFGLSQLHQLRGRVGRGEYKSYCILISDSNKSASAERLRVMCKSNDGFYIAEQDLLQRGPGDFFGQRQHGLPEMRIASISGDIRVLKQAQNEADALMATGLDTAELQPLRDSINHLFDNTDIVIN